MKAIHDLFLRTSQYAVMLRFYLYMIEQKKIGGLSRLMENLDPQERVTFLKTEEQYNAFAREYLKTVDYCQKLGGTLVSFGHELSPALLQIPSDETKLFWWFASPEQAKDLGFVSVKDEYGGPGEVFSTDKVQFDGRWRYRKWAEPFESRAFGFRILS